MDVLSRKNLSSLIEERDPLCLTILMPTAPPGGPRRESRTRFKSLLGDARRRLERREIPEESVRDLLAPLEHMLSQDSQWHRPGEGLALFRSPRTFANYRIPSPLPERVVLSDRFQVKPLLPQVQNQDKFLVLSVSRNWIRLVECSRLEAKEHDLPGVPRSMQEALQLDEPAPSLQFHTRSPGGAGRRPAIFHGQGAGQDTDKRLVRQYFQKVDSALRPLLNRLDLPLVLAGVEYLLPIYRQANTFGRLQTGELQGNHDDSAPWEIRDRAWREIFEERFDRSRAVLQRLRESQGTDQAATDIKTILPAACQGRVESLVVAVDRELWGRFEPGRGVSIGEQEDPDGQNDLLNLAVAETLLQGGEALGVSAEQMPEDALIGALYRY